MPSRQNQSQLSVSMDGVSLGIWENKTGGNTSGTANSHFLGGMGPKISLGAQPDPQDLTLSKLEDIDIISRKKWIRSRVGVGKVTVGEQNLDDEGTAIGEPEIYRGTLINAQPPDRDAQGTGAAMYTIVVDVETVA